MANRAEEFNGTKTAAGSPAKSTRDQQVADFEKLLSDLSATFIRVSVEQVDAEIERWLQLIVLAMEVDRGNVVQFDHSEGIFYVTHQWARPGVTAPDKGRKVDNLHSIPGSPAKCWQATLS
ncbi:MAG: hypothetical protein WBY93_05635 [Candidatus Binatus sp.]